MLASTVVDSIAGTVLHGIMPEVIRKPTRRERTPRAPRDVVDGRSSWSAQMNWTGIWNRLWRMLDMPAPCYFSGSRFLAFIREANPELPEYGELMEARRQRNLSTSRRDYFR